MKIKILISSVIALIVVIIVMVKFGMFEKFGLKKNEIVISNDVNDYVSNNKLKVYWVEYNTGDSVLLYAHKRQFVSSTVDWYGKDHIVVQFGAKKIKHQLSGYKTTSWEKIKYSLKIKEQSNSVIFLWEINSDSYKSSGADTVLK
jgi:hypothetical protein